MKQPKLMGILLSCLVFCSGTVLSTSAEEVQPATEAVQTETTALETETTDVTEAAAETETTAAEETTAMTETTQTTETVQTDAEEPSETTPDNLQSAPNDLVGASLDVRKITLSLSATPSETPNGFVKAADGTMSYLVEGEKMTGRFSVETDYIKGDLNGDGTVSSEDAALILVATAQAGATGSTPEDVILQQNSEIITTGYEADQISDIDNNGAINTSDAAEMLVYISRLGAGDDLYPLGCGQYYADASGNLQTDWIRTETATYYADNDYTLVKGWEDLDGDTYYFNDEGELQTGYVEFEDDTYFFAPDGAMVTGWLDVGDGIYHFDEQTGKQAFGVTTINGDVYYFNENGSLQTGGILNCPDGTRYADENGVLLTSWQNVEGERLYFDESGLMATGRTEIDGGIYYFTEDGKQLFGWQDFGNGEIYLDEISGKMAVGFVPMSSGTCYFNEDGKQLFGWQDINSEQYYFDEDGYMLTGKVTMDGTIYHFNADGVYDPVKICLDAGHYAKYNHSPVNDAYWESDFTWKIHLYLKEALESYGIEVITTREDKDTDLGLSARGYTSEGCDLFLSLHSNACGVESIDAPLACCQVSGVTDELGQMLADKVAEVMETNQGGKIWKRQGKDGDWYSVLWGAAKVGTPGILLEHSYHTNRRATEWLLNDDNVKRMAEAEAELLAEYFDMAD